MTVHPANSRSSAKPQVCASAKPQVCASAKPQVCAGLRGLGAYTFDLATGVVMNADGGLVHGANGRPLKPLTRREMRLLAALINAGGEVVAPERLATEAFGCAPRPGSCALVEMIHRLRQKLPPDEHGWPLVRCQRGEGYWIALGAGAGLLAAPSRLAGAPA